MANISLTRNKFALIDDEDHKLLSRHKWYAHKHGNTFYSKTKIAINGKRKTVAMHRLIMGVTDPKIEVDHIDGNGLNNQKSNLRIVTHLQNSMNQKKRKNCSSIYKGVCWNKKCNKWHTQIRIDGKLLNVGLFINEKDAAVAYDNKAKEVFGEFARLNFKI